MIESSKPVRKGACFPEEDVGRGVEPRAHRDCCGRVIPPDFESAAGTGRDEGIRRT